MCDRGQPLPNAGPESPARRGFLTGLSVGLSGLVGTLLGVPILGYLLSPLIRPPDPEWVDLGSINAYRVGDTTLVPFKDPSPLAWAGRTAQTAVYVRRTAVEDFTVFSIHCTHLGCPVSWLPSAKLFFCPCHGGVFYADGSVAFGPPPRPLHRYEIRLDAGRLLVKTQPLPAPRPAERPANVRISGPGQGEGRL